MFPRVNQSVGNHGRIKQRKGKDLQFEIRFSSITIGNIIASKRTLKVRTEEKQKRKAVKDLENELKQDKINEKIVSFMLK